MSNCVIFDDNGFLVNSLQSPDLCEGYLLISPTEYNLMVQSVDLQPEEIVSVFILAFVSVVSLSALAFKVDVFKNVIKRS